MSAILRAGLDEGVRTSSLVPGKAFHGDSLGSARRRGNVGLHFTCLAESSRTSANHRVLYLQRLHKLMADEHLCMAIRLDVVEYLLLELALMRCDEPP
eukprot:scaffold191322_cov39-Tisochrysis_lutea.AAC.2